MSAFGLGGVEVGSGEWHSCACIMWPVQEERGSGCGVHQKEGKKRVRAASHQREQLVRRDLRVGGVSSARVVDSIRHAQRGLLQRPNHLLGAAKAQVGHRAEGTGGVGGQV